MCRWILGDPIERARQRRVIRYLYMQCYRWFIATSGADHRLRQPVTAWRYMNWVGVVTASLSVAPVFAQDSTEEPAQRDRGSLEEVVVTARNRTEFAQEVPIPISVLSGARSRRNFGWRAT